MEELSKFSKCLFAILMYILEPERCIPRYMEYDGREWFLAEDTIKMDNGKVRTYVFYTTFINGQGHKRVNLIEETSTKRSKAYRRMHRMLWRMGYFKF